MVINQSSNQMITNWQGFNIGQTESVQFNQPGANSVALNRVIGQDPTAILGKLNANGQIFITNPSGVFFGPNFIINVGSLMATSLQISDQDFLNRNYRFTQDPSKSLASVINEGQINASGYIGLLGPRAENRGMLMVNLGSIALGSGKAATMDFSGDGLINFAITEPVDGSFVDKDGKTVDNGAFNSGTIQADGGKVLLTAHTAQKMVRSVDNNTGVIRAQSVSKRNGAIYLEAGPNGTATNEGTLDASGTASGETGGSVRILGHKVGQLGNAMVDVSGDQGGGEVLIGGDYQGKGSVQNAAVTFGGSNTTVKANAITNGNGGKVIYWADGTTRFYGAIEAKGGANSGDGGFVEVSGKRFLDFNGEVVTTAANGQRGTLLLDPDDIIIVDQLSDDDDPEISGDHEILFGDGSGTFSISVAVLEGLNATNDIILQANDSITFNDLADNIFDLQTTSNNSATFITINGSITFLDTNDLLRTQGGAIHFIAGDALALGMLESNGGDINLSSESSIDTYGINSGGGFVSLSAESGINVKRNIMTGGGDFLANADVSGFGIGAYTQDSPAFIDTSGGEVILLASDFNFLNGYTGADDVFGVPSSIITHSFSLANGFGSSNSITIAPSVIGGSICVGTTGPSCIELNQSEITSLRTSKLVIGDLFSGTITFGDIDLGHKETSFISAINIEGNGSNVVFRDDISFTSAQDINFIFGSNIEPHISGFSKSIEFSSANFTLDSSSSITILGGDVNIAATNKDLSGQINLNGGELKFPAAESILEEILEDLFFEEFLEDLFFLEEELLITFDDPFGLADFGFDPFDPIFDDILLDDENLGILGAIPGLTADEFLGIIEDKDQAQQVSVLGDFLDNGSGKSGC
jgi:filamentous hemagglutinin family protein